MSLRYIPSVEWVRGEMKTLYPDLPELVSVDMARSCVEDIRKELLARKLELTREVVREKVLNRVHEVVSLFKRQHFHRVVNATGTILHTGMGRAPLDEVMLHYLVEEITPYTNLEIDLQTGKRGQRLEHADYLLRLLTGAEMTAVVNNNAAAVFLSLNTLSEGKEVIVSRGQLVEIGGSFRIPEVIKKSGAIMVEVGTTNKTHLSDFENALNENTGAILITHTSNFEVKGFTAFPEMGEIISLAHSRNIPVLYDLGSGAFLNMKVYGAPEEPIVRKMVEMGFDAVTFSGDKLLGGPQSGIIVGKASFIEKIRSNPIMRAVRCDKWILAILEKTLLYYVSDEAEKIPFYAMLSRSTDYLEEMAAKILKDIETPADMEIKVVSCSARIGSGACPVYEHPGRALQIDSGKMSEDEIAGFFRNNSPSIMGRIDEGHFLLSMNTITEKDINVIHTCIDKLIKEHL